MKIETNLIYCGDNLEILAKFPEKSVDLIYADPPFFSNRQYEIIWGDGAEMKVFEDRWKGGINAYIEWMQERLWQCYRVLKDTGSMYLHCDWHANHRLRVAMDDIFNEKNFRNEIIWFYNSGARRKLDFGKRHDTILRYSKGSAYIFNDDDTALREPYSPDINIPKCKEHYYDPRGKVIGDTWQLPIIAQNDKRERTGYPTQKPEALLARIIKASSNKGDIVLDPFCGCGTTLAVAQQLGRRWIGIDVAPKACNLMKDRLIKVGARNIQVIGAPKTIEDLRDLEPFHFQNWVIDRIGGVPSSKKSGDMGIDGFTFMAREPVQVKQSEGVGRNVVDNFETAIRREHKTIGYIVAFSFSKGAYEEVARARQEDKLDIKLVRVGEMDKYFVETEPSQNIKEVKHNGK